MEFVKETPVKRRKTESGYEATSQPYDSQDDSGDNLFNDYESVATIPLPQKSLRCGDKPNTLPSPTTHITQPTQILNPINGEKPSVVQVAASSSPRMLSASSPISVRNKRPGGILASAMAPAGTTFRAPMGIKRAAVIDLSDDDGPVYRGDSSDDESQRIDRGDIKPSTFIRSAQELSVAKAAKNPAPESSAGAARFKEITSGSFYKPIENTKSKGSTLSGSVYDSRNRDDNHTTSTFAASKRSADIMANAYGGSKRPLKEARQTAPAKSQQEPNISIDDIEDFQIRHKVKKMQAILPKHSVLSLKNALMAKKANFDDAIDLLMTQEEQPQEIDLTLSDHDISSSKQAKQKRVPAKQQIKAPVQSIQERWTATQALQKPSQVLTPSPTITPKKPRRRLVQGQKKPSSIESPSNLSSPLATRKHSPVSDDSDSGIGEEPEADVETDSKVLDFLNTCTVPDLVDIAAIATNIAELLLTKKPFRSLHEARQVTADAPGNKKKTVKRPIGDKVVEKCIEMWAGYEAIDNLVRQCETLGKPVADEMKKWGVDVFGASKAGELDVVNLSDIASEAKSEGRLRDSGIGTPSSIALSADENSDADVKRTPKHVKPIFSLQPQMMGNGVILKDYQVVGVNWLSLLFEKKLSCILADDMGLGKTCQVIAFLAHLFEKGIKGPHLVVVPGSTLENWLREFSIFCPGLVVMPYYGKYVFSYRKDIRN